MNNAHDTILDLLIASDKRREAGKLDDALALTDKARALLEKSRFADLGWDLYDDWGFLLHAEFQVRAALGDSAALLRIAHEVIGKFSVDKETCYSQNFKAMRFRLREAHAFLAEHERAQNNLKEAIKQIDSAFQIKSGNGEYLDPFEDFYERRALIYCEAYEQAPEKYRKKFFSILQVIFNKEDDPESCLRLTSEKIKAFADDEEFLAYKRNTPLEKLRVGKGDETWSEAVARFQKVFKLLKFDARQMSYNDLEVTSKVTPAQLSAFEQLHDCRVAPSLRQMYLECGAIRMRDSDMWGSLTMYGYADGDQHTHVGGLESTIGSVWGGRPEFAESFSAQEIALLNTNYFSFGHYFHDDNAYTHLYFTRDGQFGELYYHQDDWSDAYASIRGLLDALPRQSSFDCRFSGMTDMVIQEMMRYKERKDNEG